MTEIVLITIIVLFSIFSRKENVVQLLFFFLPFHTFLKSAFVYFLNSGMLFSNWKELVTLILSARLLYEFNKYLDKKMLLLSFIFIIIILIYCIEINTISLAIPTIRDHIFPIILFLGISTLKQNKYLIKNITMCLAASAFLHGIIGFIQVFWLNIPISLLMGRIDFIDAGGFVQYKTSSARILGIERMAGILGGPNSFGIFFGLIVIFITNSLLYKYITYSNKERIFLRIVLVLSVLSLLFSFSRAGWIIAIFGVTLLFHFYNLRLKLKYIIASILIFSTSILILKIYFPWASDIILSSISGKEESAADRSNNFLRALIQNFTEPLGHGIGTTDIRNKGYLYFAESIFMNIGFEIGLLGLLYLIIIHFTIINKILKLKKFDYLPFSKLAVAISLPSILASFFSVNTYGIPFIYLWWLILGMGVNNTFYLLQNKVVHYEQKLKFIF